MKITNITPPTERIFTLELTENELKYLAMMVGDTDVKEMESLIEEKSWKLDLLPGIKSDETFAYKFYNMVVDTFES